MLKKKILFVIPSLNSGGAENSLVTLLSLLDYDKYDVDLFLFRREGLFLNQVPANVNIMDAGQDYLTFDGSFRAGIISFLWQFKIGLAIKRIFYAIALRRSGGLRNAYAWKYLKSVLRPLDKHYDVSVGYLEGTSIYYALEQTKAGKYIGYIHTDYSRVPELHCVDLPYFKKLDYIVGVSESCSRIVSEIFPEISPKVKTVENIVSSNLICKKAEFEKNVYGTHDKTIILTIGRLAHVKGIDIAVQACSELVKNGYNIKWFHIGKGETYSETKQLIIKNNLENIFIMLGESPNPLPYLNECDIYVQPSRFEGKSIAIDEAKCLKKPIILTQNANVCSQITDNVTGLVSEAAPEAIAQKVAFLIDNPSFKQELINNLISENSGNDDEIYKFYSLLESYTNHSN